MKEIGGYFGLESLIQKPYYPELIPVNTARHALVYILRARHVKKIWLPYFLCESVKNACETEGIEIGMYHIDADFYPVCFELPEKKSLKSNEWLYIVNYYGQLDAEIVKKYKIQFENVILDNVQAFFQKPISGIDTVYSCRKFFGVPDGGYVATDAQIKLQLQKDVSSGRLKHLLGRFETGSASSFYADFKEADHAFMDMELRTMSALTQNFLGAIDYDAVKRKREANFRVLADALNSRNKLSVNMPIGPYAYPFYCNDGMTLKKRLAENNIYIATLWPNVLDMDDSLEKDYAENILPLPCDQRYGVQEMERVVDCITKIMQ